MALTVPFVVAGLGRYLFLVHRHDLGEEPEHVLLSDRVILGAVAGWADRVGGRARRDLGDAAQARLVERFLDLRESRVHRLPAARDEVDEQREVVHPRVPLGEEIALEMLEPAQDLVHHPAHLGEVARARAEVLAEAVLDRVGQALLELRRRLGERVDRAARARSSAASTSAGVARAAAAAASRSFAR